MSERSSRAERGRSAGLLAAVVAVLLAAPGCSKEGASSGSNETGAGTRRGDPLRVAAASDLALAFEAVGAAFEQESGRRVELSFGSTGLLAKQIAEGAPYDVFAAADASYVEEVVRAGACLEDTRALYARGRIALWTKDEAALPKSLEDLALPQYAKVAIANPEHAPYGRAAREALTNAGVWPSVQPRAVFGENIQHTLMFARSGNAEVAIVALSLAIPSQGSYVLIDEGLHEPLDQELVVCKGGSRGGKLNEARAFVAFVGGETGRAILHRYGFSMPGDSTKSAR